MSSVTSLSADSDDYFSILRDSIPVLDVRAPTEFEKGAIPSATNMPILDDYERQQVGITYKEKDQDAAIAKGFELVNEDVQQERVGGWLKFAEQNPNGMICCWRGGLRSQIAQEWLAERNVYLPRVAGGSKALRAFCLSVLEESRSRKFVVLSGKTGSGKTEIIKRIKPSIDLERLANHRGSAFGSEPTPQPSPISFESELAAALLRLSSTDAILVENESRMIGRLGIPDPFFLAMQDAPIVQLTIAQCDRIPFTYVNYVEGSEYDDLAANLVKIRRRLGLERFQEILTLMKKAFVSGTREAHYRWIELLLDYYYDPMYEYQLAKKRDRVVFEGNEQEVMEYLASHYNIC